MVTAVPIPSVVAAAELAGGLLDITIIIALVVILLVKELGSATIGAESRRPRLRFLVSALNAPILSLLAVFILIVVERALDIL